MDLIGQIVLILVLKVVSPASISTSTVPPHENTELKTSRAYQVTENTSDIPDNRTLPPIMTNFGVVRPLNFGNNSVVVHNIAQHNNGEDNEENSKESEDNSDGKLKKNSFSILHIKAEYDDKPVTEHHQNVFTKVFGGLKSYMYNLKKGVVDGLHNLFHQHDVVSDKKDEEIEFQDKPNKIKCDPSCDKPNHFHRSFDGDQAPYDDNDYYDDEFKDFLSQY